MISACCSITYREYIFNASTKKLHKLPTTFSMYPRETNPFLSGHNILSPQIRLLLKSRNTSFTFDFSLFSGLHAPWRQTSKLHRKIYVISQSFLMQILCSASGCIFKLHQIFASVSERISSARPKCCLVEKKLY